jgi:hypothetical protein
MNMDPVALDARTTQPERAARAPVAIGLETVKGSGRST